MCGITGFIDYKNTSSITELNLMVKSLYHRGPDGNGTFIDVCDNAIVGLGHTRLSILDLSEAGHQPMTFGDYTIILNGEIYNFKEIRKQLILLGNSFESESDTEVVIKSFIQNGINCVDDFIGMFAFVIYDKKNKKIYFCRDRAGVKPLYIYLKEDIILFGSELKALMTHPQFEKIINIDSVADFLSYGYIKSPNSIFKETIKLEPGNWFIFDIQTRKGQNKVYWDVLKYYEQPLLKIEFEEAIQETRKLLVSACNYRMVADVPVGVFLSGGYDSACVSALLQKDRSEKLKTFTIGFPDGANEAKEAQKISQFLGTDHTSFDCTISEAKTIIQDLPYYYDEPCADISAIPTIMVSKLARKKVTVALSADGGDEVFAGYNGYFENLHRWAQISQIPTYCRPMIGEVLENISKIIPSQKISLKHKLSGLGKTVKANPKNALATFMNCSTKIPDSIIYNVLSDKKNKLDRVVKMGEMNSILGALQYLDYTSTLTDLLLTKVDRASMSASLEGREPLLDHRLLKFAAQLPPSFKNNGIQSKIILKEIVHREIPKKLMDRPKMGFDLPIYDWLKNDLEFLIEDYLGNSKLNEHQIFNPNYIKILIGEFKRNELLYKEIIWRLIVFQMWYERWISK
jgi:asparagine synthase (glutamine-hydrolysing)